MTGFASFYVTGWQGSGGGFANPLVGQGDDETPGDGYIMGHFVTYLSPDRRRGKRSCNWRELGVCVAVMTESCRVHRKHVRDALAQAPPPVGRRLWGG